MVGIKTVTLHRRDDPRHEYRQIILYQADGRHAVWEVIGFVTDPDTMKRSRLAFGGLREMLQYFDNAVRELGDQGFAICDPEHVPHMFDHLKRKARTR